MLDTHDIKDKDAVNTVSSIETLGKKSVSKISSKQNKDKTEVQF